MIDFSRPQRKMIHRWRLSPWESKRWELTILWDWRRPRAIWIRARFLGRGRIIERK